MYGVPSEDCQCSSARQNNQLSRARDQGNQSLRLYRVFLLLWQQQCYSVPCAERVHPAAGLQRERCRGEGAGWRNRDGQGWVGVVWLVLWRLSWEGGAGRSNRGSEMRYSLRCMHVLLCRKDGNRWGRGLSGWKGRLLDKGGGSCLKI